MAILSSSGSDEEDSEMSDDGGQQAGTGKCTAGSGECRHHHVMLHTVACTSPGRPHVPVYKLHACLSSHDHFCRG